MKEIQINDEEKEAIINLIENNINLNQIIEKIKQSYSKKLNYEFVKKFAKQHCNKKYLKLEKRWTDISPEIVIPETIIGTEIQLNDNDAQTLLKDLSYILQDLKALTTDIAKITKGIDTAAYNLKEIALAIKPRS